MSEPELGRAVLELSTDSTKFTKGLDDAKAGAKGLEGNFKTAGQSAQSLGAALNDLGASTSKWASSHAESFTAVGQAAGLLLGAAAASTAAIVVLGQRGADVDDVRSAFARLNDDGPKALDALQRGIGGLLTDYELMKPLNAAMSAGFKLNADDAYTLSRAAWVLADAQGKGLKESYDTIAQAMATGKVNALAALGVNVEQKGAALELKKALDAEGEAASSNATKQANRQAAMEALNRVVLAAGTQELDFGEKLTRVKVQIGNMTDSLGVAIATSPVLGAAMDGAGNALQSAFGANQTQTIQALVTAIGQIAIMAVQSAQVVVSAATEMATAYYNTRAAVDTLFEAFNEREIARVEGLVHTYEAIAATSTKPTSEAKLRLMDLRIELERLKGAAKGFNADANDSLVAQDRLAAAGQHAQQALDAMIRSMKAAAGQQVSSASVAAGLAKAHTDLAAATGGATTATAEHLQVLALLEKAHAHTKAELALQEGAWRGWESTVGAALQHIPTGHLLGDLDVLGSKLTYISGIPAGTKIGEQIDIVPPKVQKATDSIGQLSQAFAQLAQVSGGSLGTVIQSMGTLVASLNTALKAQASFQEGQKAWSSGEALKGIAGMATGIMGVVAAAVAAVQGIKAIFNALDRNKGRDVVVDFAETFGGFDALHAKLLELGAAGEALWVKLTQGVGRNDPKAAQAAIDEITKALAAQAANQEAATVTTEAGAQATIETAAQAAIALDQLNDRLKTNAEAWSDWSVNVTGDLQHLADAIRGLVLPVPGGSSGFGSGSSTAFAGRSGALSMPALLLPTSARDSAVDSMNAVSQIRRGQPIVIENRVVLDGREVARNQVRHLPNALADVGIRSR